MTKDYYCYVRPKIPNRPWNLERLPLGSTALTLEKSNDSVKKSEVIKFSEKLNDDIHISLKDGTFTLPLGTYMIQYNMSIEVGAAGVATVSLVNSDKNNVSIYDTHVHVSQAESPITLNGLTVLYVNSIINNYSILNNSGVKLKLLHGTLVITKLD